MNDLISIDESSWVDILDASDHADMRGTIDNLCYYDTQGKLFAQQVKSDSGFFFLISENTFNKYYP